MSAGNADADEPQDPTIYDVIEKNIADRSFTDMAYLARYGNVQPSEYKNLTPDERKQLIAEISEIVALENGGEPRAKAVA